MARAVLRRIVLFFGDRETETEAANWATGNREVMQKMFHIGVAADTLGEFFNLPEDIFRDI